MKKNKNANEEINPEKELKPYKASFIERIPYAVKALFVKYWFFGAEYFFIMMGLGELISSAAGDNVTAGVLGALIMGVAMGAVNDLFVYNILTVFETDKKESYYYRFFKSKKVWSFFINIVYGIAVGIVSATICSAINNAVINGVGTAGFEAWSWVCAEPFTFAVIALIVDAALITIRTLLIIAYKKIRHKEI